MSKIVMTSAPYCYGPTSKLLCIAEALPDEHRLIFVGSEPGLSLARNFRFSDVIEAENHNNWGNQYRKILKEADLLVSFLEYRSLSLAEEYGVQSIFFDTLYWLRTSVPPFVEKTEVYIAQKFFRPPLITTNFQCNLIEVGPVIPEYIEATLDMSCQNDRSSILVNFGGLRSPIMELGADISYVTWIIKILAASNIPEQQMILCLPKYLNRSYRSINGALPAAKILFLDAQEFRERLITASLLITPPGLEVILEAMYIGIPIVFLPPHNGTQVIQSAIYKKLGIQEFYLQTESERNLEESSLPLHELTKAVQKCNMQMSADSVVLDSLGKDLGNQVNEIISNARDVRRKCDCNRELLRSLGEGGRITTAEHIRNLIKKS